MRGAVTPPSDDFARFFEGALDLNGIAAADGYFRRVNAAWERTLGWTAEEIGATPWLDFVHPEDRETTADAGRRLFTGDSILSFENRFRCRDGSYRLLQWHAEAVGDEAYCSGRDVTLERARLVDAAVERVDALRGRGPWFFAIFDHAPFAMTVTTRAGGVTVAVNDAFLKLFDFTRDQVLGRTSVDLGIADPESRVALAKELAEHGVVRDFECLRRTRTGARVVLLLNVDAIEVDGDSYVLTSVRDITRESDAANELRSLVDHLPELAWTARPDGFIDFYNRRWYDYTGTRYEDMEGWGWQSVHHPDELPRVMESWARCIATREPFEQTFPLRGKDGVFRWFLTRVAPIFDDLGELVRWVGINTDVDDQRRHQELLAQTTALVDSADDAIITKDLDGTIRSWNPGATRLLGYETAEVVGQPITLLLPLDRYDEERRIVDEVRTGSVARYETVRRKKDGSLVAVSITVSPVRDRTGAIVFASKIMRDISERNLAERERARLVKELQAFNLDLEERVRSRTAELSRTLNEREALLREKTSLLQEVHHRVKNNLQMISSLLNLQARQIKDPDTRAVFLESQTRVRSIALLHESLYQSADFGRVDIEDYVEKLLATLLRTYGEASGRARLATHALEVYLPLEAAVPSGLIVTELVTNALKHAFVDAPLAPGNEIRVEVRRDGDRVTIRVADNGAGFAGTIDPARDETMGLTLVRDLAQQLGGQAEFENVGGARCTVSFPSPNPEPGGPS